VGENEDKRMSLTHKVLFEITSDPKKFREKAQQLERNITGLFKYAHISSLNEILCAGIACTRDKSNALKEHITKKSNELPNVFELLRTQRLLFLLQPDTPLSLLPQLHNDVERLGKQQETMGKQLTEVSENLAEVHKNQAEMFDSLNQIKNQMIMLTTMMASMKFPSFNESQI
jgi:hypothetical protein